MRLIDADALDNEKGWGITRGEYKIIDSVEPERKKGTVSYTHFSEELWGQSAICDLCGCKWQISENGDYNFCPNCGADMGG